MKDLPHLLKDQVKQTLPYLISHSQELSHTHAVLLEQAASCRSQGDKGTASQLTSQARKIKSQINQLSGLISQGVVLVAQVPDSWT